MLCTCYSSPPTVSCQANNFSSVPLSLPPSTQRLFLQNNLIRSLRPGTFGPNLLTLWLFSNNLSTIYPGTFRHLQALEELDLGDNRHLRSLEPDTFQGLERLQSLHLYRCQLSSLPGNIFRGLVSLQYLYLQENSLLHLQVSQPPPLGLFHLSLSLWTRLATSTYPYLCLLSPCPSTPSVTPLAALSVPLSVTPICPACLLTCLPYVFLCLFCLSPFTHPLSTPHNVCVALLSPRASAQRPSHDLFPSTPTSSHFPGELDKGWSHCQGGACLLKSHSSLIAG